MRRILPFFVILNLILAGCAGAPDQSLNGGVGATGEVQNRTGGHDSQLRAYVCGGDYRCGRTIKQKGKPISPSNQPVAEKDKKLHDELKAEQEREKHLLRNRMRQFEISRFNAGESNPRRFGSDHLTLKIFLDDQTVNFENLKLIRTAANTYSFSGQSADKKFLIKGKSLEDLIDPNTNEPYKTTGEIGIKDVANNETAKIWYNAYKANLKVREDAENPIKSGSDAAQILDGIRKDTFGWVNNWGVDNGVAFYLVDIIRRIHATQPVPFDPRSLFAFSGPSVSTDQGPVAAKTNTGSAISNVQVVGNSENEGLRLISAEIKDPQTNETHEFMMDVVEDNPTAAADDSSDSSEEQTPSEQEATPADSTPAPAPTAPAKKKKPAPQQQQTQPAPQEENAPRAQRPAKKKTKAKPAPANDYSAPIEGDSYLRIDTRFPLAEKLDRAVLKYKDWTRVKSLMSPYTKEGVELRRRLANFFTYAAPLRGMILKIAEAYQTTAAFVYPTVIESVYFQDGHYTNNQWGDNGEALGPYQEHTGVAKDGGIPSTNNYEDRVYFAPASCAGAAFYNKNITQFPSDEAIGLLAYNQGAGNARKYAKRFGYDLGLILRGFAMPAEAVTYAYKQIAMYLMARDMSKAQFFLSAYTDSVLPDKANGTIIPPNGIANRFCSHAVATITASAR